jgi:outer membrane protein insertion porin family
MALVWALCTAGSLLAQGPDLAHRPIGQIRVEGLNQVSEQLVRNQIRLTGGDPYDPKTVEEDIVRITHLGRFSSVTARVEPSADNSVVLTYVVQEQPLLSDVQVVGNKAVNDQELLGLAVLSAGDPVDQFLIDRAGQEMKRRYEKEGYFVTSIEVDQEMLKEQSILLFRVREGPKPRIRGIKFRGNERFSDDELGSKIKSKTYILILRKGELSREQLDDDANRVRDYYRERGFLDAQVGRQIELSPNQKDAVVVFVVDEGVRYTVDSIKVEGNQIASAAQVIEAMDLRIGDVFSNDRLKKSQQSVTDMYGRIGFLETKVQIERLFHEQEPKVDVQVKIEEGVASTAGRISVTGNQTTKQKVILRQVRGIEPGRRFDRTGIENTERRLRESSLFSEANLTVLGNPDDLIRDVVIEVKEAESGTLSFGAGISSDAGVIGAIDLVQRNFDIADPPESMAELFSGKAFRGAGQYFSINIQPGNEVSRYAVNFREPYLLDSNYFLDTSVFFWERAREDYDEQRVGGSAGIGQRFGDVWSARITPRYEAISINSVDENAPIDVFEVEGDSVLTALGFAVTRNTTDSSLFPTRGSRMTLGLTQAGALGGDYTFPKISAEFKQFWTVDEDFLGRRTVLSMNVETGYLLDDAPVFERFYAGGHRSFRGFDFRGVGPRGDYRKRTVKGVPIDPKDPTTFDIKEGDDPVGGDFLFLLGFEYNFPIYQDIFRMVFFTDTGTVQEDIGFDEYRVSVGAGIRLKIPFLGQAPFAFDVAIPVLKQPEDETRLFSFDLAVPF